MNKKLLLTFLLGLSTVFTPSTCTADIELLITSGAQALPAVESLIRYAGDATDIGRLDSMPTFSRLYMIRRWWLDTKLGMMREAVQTLPAALSVVMGHDPRSMFNSAESKALTGTGGMALAAQVADLLYRIWTVRSFNVFGERRESYLRGLTRLTPEEGEEFERVKAQLRSLARGRAGLQTLSALAQGGSLLKLGQELNSSSNQVSIGGVRVPNSAGIVAGFAGSTAQRILSILYRRKYDRWVNRIIKKGREVFDDQDDLDDEGEYEEEDDDQDEDVDAEQDDDSGQDNDQEGVFENIGSPA